MIEKYKAKRLEKVKPATVNRELATLKNMFTMAIKWGYIKTNPAKEVKAAKGTSRSFEVFKIQRS